MKFIILFGIILLLSNSVIAEIEIGNQSHLIEKTYSPGSRFLGSSIFFENDA